MTARHALTRYSFALGACAALTTAGAADESAVERAAPPPVFVVNEDGSSTTLEGGKAMGTVEYSQGDPSNEEQHFLELMNRARMDPSAEADRILVDYNNADVTSAVNFFLNQRPGVEYTRQENHDAFDAIAPQPPFALNQDLTNAAEFHNGVMLQRDQQTHQFIHPSDPGQNEPDLGQRLTNEGYTAQRFGESIFAFVKSMVHAHAGFGVDWGQGIPQGETRPATGHRDNLMNVPGDRTYREVGIHVLDDPSNNNNVGPQLITIDFAKALNDPNAFVTGVAYEDVNENGFYDPGEGRSGVRVHTDKSQFFAITTASGGYAVPVPKNSGSVLVTAVGQPSTPGEPLGTQEAFVNIGSDNVKVDWMPGAAPPIGEVRDFAGVTNKPIADGATTTDTIAVPAFDPESNTVGNLEVDVDIAHADRTELTISLMGPNGRSVVLFDGGLAGSGISGTFPRSLTPSESLRSFEGTRYDGNWTLSVVDSAGGVVDGSLVSWTLRVQPEWVRALHPLRSGLSVTLLKIKDSETPLKDKVIFKGEFNAGGALLPEDATGSLRLLDSSGADVLLDLPFAPAEGGPKVKAKLDLNRKGTSRGAFTIKVSAFDLADALPTTCRIELAVGDAIVSAVVPLADGKFKGTKTRPLSSFFNVDKYKTDAVGTVVKGRFSNGNKGVEANQTIDVIIGDTSQRIPVAAFLPKGLSKLVFKSGGTVSKLVVDPVAGTFLIKLGPDFAPDENGLLDVSIRFDDDLFGATVRPVDKGTKTIY